MRLQSTFLVVTLFWGACESGSEANLISDDTFVAAPDVDVGAFEDVGSDVYDGEVDELVDTTLPPPSDSLGEDVGGDDTSVGHDLLEVSTDTAVDIADIEETVDVIEVPLGTPLDPIAITAFPFVVDSDSRLAPSDILDRYDCASADESGPEIVYEFELTEAAEFVAEVLESDDVDVDLHILESPPPSARSVSVPCLTRANTRLSTDLERGTYWLVVDTYVNASGPRAGAYRLAVETTILDAWQERTVASGITWRKKVYSSYAGGRQTINVLEVVPEAFGNTRLLPYLKRGGGCIRPSVIGKTEGAIAAINVGFFDTGPGSCPPLDLVKAEGEVLSYNKLTGAAQRSFGWTPEGETLVDWVDAYRDWPEAYSAIGTYPSLVTDGDVLLEPDKDTSFFDSRHPRSAIGRTADGRILLVTVDGRTSAGAGMTLSALAQHMVNLGAIDAANLDGGGSTTMWIRDKSINGIVNFPSDNGVSDHWGERPVSDVLLVFPE